MNKKANKLKPKRQSIVTTRLTAAEFLTELRNIPKMTLKDFNNLNNSPEVQELLMGGGMMFGLPITPHPLPNKKGRITKREDVD